LAATKSAVTFLYPSLLQREFTKAIHLSAHQTTNKELNKMNDNQAVYVAGRGRPSSRVLSEPGGARSLNFGGWTEEELEKQREAHRRKHQVLAGEYIFAFAAFFSVLWSNNFIGMLALF
jgi:hypothetical protein